MENQTSKSKIFLNINLGSSNQPYATGKISLSLWLANSKEFMALMLSRTFGSTLKLKTDSYTRIMSTILLVLKVTIYIC